MSGPLGIQAAPWPSRQARPHLVSMGTEKKSRLDLTPLMKIYLGSKSRKKPQAQRVVNGAAGRGPLEFQGLQLLFIAVPDDLKMIRRREEGREPPVLVHRAIHKAFPFLWGQSCDHVSRCFSKLHVCFCSFCQTKSIQLVATFKKSRLTLV